MATLDLKMQDSIFVLTMTNGEQANTFTEDVLNEFHEMLAEIEAFKGNGAVILASNHPKHWCTGINLEWLSSKPAEYHEQFKGMVDDFLIRWALLDLPTIGCLSGHAYAGGALLASTLDFRFMRNDRGWFCFPEVDVRIPFTPFMTELVEMLTEPRAIRELMLTGKRIGGKEAAELGVVDGAFPAEELFERSMEMAKMLAGKDRGTYANIKMRMKRRLAAFRK